jgi:hypothetical protein
MEPNTAIATTTTAQVSQSSSSETNKKRNNHRRRNNNKNKTRPAAAEEASTSQATKQPKKKEPLRGFKNPPKLEEEDQNEEADADVCFICTRPIDYYSVAPCDHRTCHLCTLRLRVLYKTKNCAYCKVKKNEYISLWGR